MKESLSNHKSLIEQDQKKLREVFVARAIYRLALEKKNQAEGEAIAIAPKGFLFKITAKTDGTMTRIHDSHKPNPWYEELKEGQIVYSPRINSAVRDGYTTSTFTSWINGPIGRAFSLNRHDPVRINDDSFELDLISNEEYSERRLKGDMTLYRVSDNNVTETVH